MYRYLGWLVGFISIAIVQGCAVTNNSSEQNYVNALEVTETYNKANEAYSSGLLSEAETQFIQLTKNQPHFFDAWFKLGNIYVRTGQLDGAVKMYEKCIKINPEDVRPWHNLALTRIKQSQEALNEGMTKVLPNSQDQDQLDELLDRISSISKLGNKDHLAQSTNNYKKSNELVKTRRTIQPQLSSQPEIAVAKKTQQVKQTYTSSQPEIAVAKKTQQVKQTHTSSQPEIAAANKTQQVKQRRTSSQPEIAAANKTRQITQPHISSPPDIDVANRKGNAYASLVSVFDKYNGVE